MPKRLVDIADDKLDRAREILGAESIKSTVNGALDEVIALDRRRRLLDRLAEQRGIDLGDEQVMSDAWR
ncbi:MAG: type II toxin-antitoxin system VapB family antitoxin [Acidimicrobiia bacterium]|nr:type II toxin-antitoxin system VapB family antitoxin [Acidimicrobiia bacterium]NNJ47155.1 type II toxin-antitoxin system VapB family antitoxin [Acidimicrobiia bacterium]